MGWAAALIMCVCLPLILIALVALFALPERRPPVIKEKPAPDSRNSIYSVGRHVK